MSWIPLTVPPKSLTEARLELHHAVQLVAIGVAKPLLPARDDDSHTTLVWRSGSGWVSHQLPGTGGLRAGLRPADLTLTVGRGDEPARTCALAGRTREEGLDWLRGILAEEGVATRLGDLDFHYDMPDHPVARGQAFDGDLGAGHRELTAWYSNAEMLVSEVARDHEGSSAVLTWPHHFDLATLLSFGASNEGNNRTVGVGLSPGDGHYPEPYVYVTPWPFLADRARPAVDPGGWRTEDFFGATLTATQLLAGESSDQEDRARRFLAAAVAGSIELLAP